MSDAKCMMCEWEGCFEDLAWVPPPSEDLSDDSHPNDTHKEQVCPNCGSTAWEPM